MTARYTVTHSPFGFESDVGTHRLNYAVTDNKPDRVPVYRASEREYTLYDHRAAEDYYVRVVKLPPFRHVAYCVTKEDADKIAASLNFATETLGDGVVEMHA